MALVIMSFLGFQSSLFFLHNLAKGSVWIWLFLASCGEPSTLFPNPFVCDLGQFPHLHMLIFFCAEYLRGAPLQTFRVLPLSACTVFFLVLWTPALWSPCLSGIFSQVKASVGLCLSSLSLCCNVEILSRQQIRDILGFSFFLYLSGIYIHHCWSSLYWQMFHTSYVECYMPCYSKTTGKSSFCYSIWAQTKLSISLFYV